MMVGWAGGRGGRRLVSWLVFFTNTRFLWGRKRVVYILHWSGRGVYDGYMDGAGSGRMRCLVEMKARATTDELSWGGGVKIKTLRPTRDETHELTDAGIPEDGTAF